MSVNRRKIVACLLVMPLAGCELDLTKASELSESEVKAQTYGYVTDAARADALKFSIFKAGQNCANCRLASGPSNSPWLGCSLFPARKVAAMGWCAGWDSI